MDFIDWLTGFISGTAATLIGAIIFIYWDYRKIKATEYKILNVVKADLENNKEILKLNELLINKELQTIHNKNQTFLDPLHPLQSKFWEVLIINTPDKIRNNPKLYSKLRDIALYIQWTNEIIKMKENFKIYNKALDVYI
ncbi:MAG: hypothetical protein J7L63_04980, partial [Thermoplasmata archaeon]|nr:hypothetical protein [Thermoplasmata archaeon]